MIDNDRLSKIRDLARQTKPEATSWRRELHQNPQTSFEETFASDFIAEKLKSFGIEPERGWAKTGVVGVIEGALGDGPSIALRADIDALPITEENTFDYISKNPGKMHACGHDGHTAMLLGASKILASEKQFKGKVVLIFQPAEEGGAGGRVMLDEGLFDKYDVASVWGMHNWPFMDAGKFAMNDGPFMAAVNDFSITVNGLGVHAAAPHKGRDPLLAGAAIAVSAQSIVSRRVNPLSPAVVSITTFHSGTANNIIPQQSKMTGTIRTFNDEDQAFIADELKRVVEATAAAYNVSAEFTMLPNGYPTLVNSANETDYAYKLCTQLSSPEKTFRKYEPTMGAEDFAFMLQKKPGCYIFIGNRAENGRGGEMLHTSRYDFNDEILPEGITYWTSLAEGLLR